MRKIRFKILKNNKTFNAQIEAIMKTPPLIPDIPSAIHYDNNNRIKLHINIPSNRAPVPICQTIFPAHNIKSDLKISTTFLLVSGEIN